MYKKYDNLPSIEHLGFLESATEVPRYVLRDPNDSAKYPLHYSCNYCGVGDSGILRLHPSEHSKKDAFLPDSGEGTMNIDLLGHPLQLPVIFRPHEHFEARTEVPIAQRGNLLSARLEFDGDSRPVTVRAERFEANGAGRIKSQHFTLFRANGAAAETVIRNRAPTAGCVKFNVSMGLTPPVWPYHTSPSVLDVSGRRVPISYEDAISRLAHYMLGHRGRHDRSCVYACGQVDYFAIFAFQEVFRLLGLRNIGGNAEHCLNAGALHNEMLTGQEGPFLTLENALRGENRFFLCNGWNGLITHPPAWTLLTKQKDLDAYIVEVAITESAQSIAERLGSDRLMLIRPATDPHFALSVGHAILHRHAGAVETRFIKRFSDSATFHKYASVARSEDFSPERVAERIVPEAHLAKRILKGILDIAAKIADPNVIPINIPSVGLSQTKGAISHCLWGDVLAMVGKYGLKADGTPAGGTLRLPGQINAQTEVQGLGRNIFFGRIPVNEAGAAEAARRMDLPDHAYRKVLERDPPRAVLDYSDPTPLGETELILIFGTQFESNMMNRRRWVEKLKKKDTTTLVVIDPIPDPFTLEVADLYIPSPPHAATTKLYQNGEWRLTLSLPQKIAPRDTRSDATIVYDAMAEISRRLRLEPALLSKHPKLKPVVRSGYLRHRFESKEAGGWLPRVDGEVNRAVLWDRIMRYLSDGGERSAIGGGFSLGGRKGDLYCRPEHPDGVPITWEDILDKGSLVYGGVGTTRYRLDYDTPDYSPFHDIYRNPAKFKFFVPSDWDLDIPGGILLTSGRSPMSEDKNRLKFAIATFNSGKHTSPVNMPEENPVYLSPSLAQRLGIRAGDRVRVTNVETGESLILPASASHRVKGDCAYISFHKCRAEMERGVYINILTSHTRRCPYTDQTMMKATPVYIERVEDKQHLLGAR